MKRVLGKIWTDPVWSKVIAAGIVGAIATPLAYHWWEGLSAAGVSVMGFLAVKTPVPNWLLGTMGLCTTLLVGMIIMVGYALLRSKAEPGPPWLNYLEDPIFPRHEMALAI